ncbi:MAG: 4Fe-4S dicluster domain-containing protein [Prevotella sp.]|nr:4Fe-4S dicluster domain-containing protein [Prevotella sp.]
MNLRKIRIILATVFFIGITLLFLDFTGALHQWLGWMAKVQFLPAVLALNAVVIILLVALTLIFGRIYCSVICPLGVFQDVIAWLHNKRKRNRYTYSPAISWLRNTMLAVLIVAFITGIGSIVALLAPYSSYGRIATNLFQPIWMLGNNALAALAERIDSYAFYDTEVWLRSLPTFIIALVTFIVVVFLAWKGGRTYCNTICPVGTVLGFLSRFSWFKVRFDVDKCRDCGLCTKNCKASCIDFKNHSVDYSRCVVCGNCVDKCKFGALRYAPGKLSSKSKNKSNADNDNKSSEANTSEPDTSRRAFLLASAMVTTAALAQEKKKVDGGLAPIEEKAIPQRHTPITPPGSLSAQNMARHCTGCQLCVAECPNEVLRPSTDWQHLMQPTMSYERGYCRPECIRCSQVCPTGAIKPIDEADKVSTKIGHAVWVKKNCLPLTDGVECGNCARHCPAGAIEMVPSDPNDEKSPKIPAVDEDYCIGCGACENLCPVRPFPAIYVEGCEQHSTV